MQTYSSMEETFQQTNLFNFNLNLLAGITFPKAGVVLSELLLLLARIHGWIMEVTTLFHITCVVLFLALEARSLEQVCIPCFAVFVTTQASSKFLYISAKRHEFQRWFDEWDRSFKGDAFLRSKMSNLALERRFVRKLSSFIVVCMAVPICIWALSPIFPAVQRRGRMLAVNGIFPYNHTVTPLFEINTLLGVYVAWSVTMQTVTFDTFFYTLASMQIVQMRHLRTSFGRIFEDPQRNPLQLKVLVGSWVTHHQQASNLGRTLCRLYSPILAVQFATTTMLLCLGAFAIASKALDMSLIPMCAAYCISNMTQLLLICRFGDQLYSESEGLTLEGFGNDWYLTPKATKADLKVIFQRSQTPLKMSAFGVMPLSSETFLKIVYSAFSYFLVMMQFVEKRKV